MLHLERRAWTGDCPISDVRRSPCAKCFILKHFIVLMIKSDQVVELSESERSLDPNNRMPSRYLKCLQIWTKSLWKVPDDFYDQIRGEKTLLVALYFKKRIFAFLAFCIFLVVLQFYCRSAASSRNGRPGFVFC